MEDTNTVMQVMKQADYTTHLDLEKAYHHIKLSPELQKYMGFKFMGRAYVYVGMPFGWNRSPLLFCRTMK
jgi:hypothetical protein